MVKSLKSYAREDEEVRHYADIHEGLEDTLVIFRKRIEASPTRKTLRHRSAAFIVPVALVTTSLDEPYLQCTGCAFRTRNSLYHDISTNRRRRYFSGGANLRHWTRYRQRRHQHYSTQTSPPKRRQLWFRDWVIHFSTNRFGSSKVFILVKSEVGSHTHMQVWLPFKQEGAPHE